MGKRNKTGRSSGCIFRFVDVRIWFLLYVIFKLNKDQIQVDERTGTNFIINDYGVGFFTMMVVDDELEAGLKEAIGVDKLDEKELKGFTVHTDQKTGINGWTMVFDPENWEQVKAAFDSGNAGNIVEWNFWKVFLKL